MLEAGVWWEVEGGEGWESMEARDQGGHHPRHGGEGWWDLESSRGYAHKRARIILSVAELTAPAAALSSFSLAPSWGRRIPGGNF